MIWLLHGHNFVFKQEIKATFQLERIFCVIRGRTFQRAYYAYLLLPTSARSTKELHA